MLVQVRLSDGSKSGSFEVSRLMKIEELRKLLVAEFQVEPERQRLFYGGKQLEDGHSVFDYGVTTNNIITLMVRPLLETTSLINNKTQHCDEESSDSDKENGPKTVKDEDSVEGVEVSQSNYYKVRDQVDLCDEAGGCWFEARIVKIVKNKAARATQEPALFDDVLDAEDFGNESSDNGKKWLADHVDDTGKVIVNNDDGFTYYALYDGYEECKPEVIKIWRFRPRAWEQISFKNVCVGDKLLANYNVEDPNKRGFFYDCTVTAKSEDRTKKFLTVDVHIGLENNVLQGCKIILVDELYRIETIGCLSSRSAELNKRLQSMSIARRIVKPECDVCKDRKNLKCKECACKVCGGKNDPDLQLLCDECNGAFHFSCLKPPLTSIPDVDNWYCDGCKNDETEIVRAGEKLKESKKKAKMASSNPKSKRDWGKGMACVGRNSICTLVTPDHRGPIPGIEVGTQWKYRLQVSSAGVHRPHVAGIHGTGKNGAYSIVLSGGYEDDEDHGEEFTYTGSGGRDLSGNKRTAKQSFDQELKAVNLALAVTCNAPVRESGAEAKDWKKGLPVRVLRSEKGRKHSKYAPEEGIRYDGIYKVVKYWPEKGQSGFRVWRYLLRRDDPTPAPWTKAGKKRINELGLVMQYPEGYDPSGGKDKNKDKSKKRGSDDFVDSSTKKTKLVNFKLALDVENLIKSDESNVKLWEDCLTAVPEGVLKFNEKVKENFMCICCQDLLFKPVTTACKHNFCHSCLTRACTSLNNTCPACRESLGTPPDLKINKTLRSILTTLFNGYENGRD